MDINNLNEELNKLLEGSVHNGNNEVYFAFYVPNGNKSDAFNYAMKSDCTYKYDLTDKQFIKLSNLFSYNKIKTIKEARKFWANNSSPFEYKAQTTDLNKELGIGLHIYRWNDPNNFNEKYYIYVPRKTYDKSTNFEQKEQIIENFKSILRTGTIIAKHSGKFRSYATYSSNGETLGTIDIQFKNNGITLDFIQEHLSELKEALQQVSLPTPTGTIYSTVSIVEPIDSIVNAFVNSKVLKTKIIIKDISYRDTFIGD